jgi:hypothetical protein
MKHNDVLHPAVLALTVGLVAAAAADAVRTPHDTRRVAASPHHGSAGRTGAMDAADAPADVPRAAEPRAKAALQVEP